MVPQNRTAPIGVSVNTQPKPSTPPELYLDLMKKILTRALTANGVERQTIRPHGPKSSVLCRFNHLACRYGFEVVRLIPSGVEDYLESGHEANNRVEDAETMLGTRQLDHMQQCIVDVLTHNIPGDLVE